MPATNFELITINPNQMGGVPCIRSTVATGMSEREILAEYPDLHAADIRECLRFAAASAMERELAAPRAE
jgi:uncharacterized protein (DUF433 family)